MSAKDGENAVNGKKVEIISKSDVGEATKANPTHATLDAIDHEMDLENQRDKRKLSTVIVPNVSNVKRLAGTDDGNKS